MIEVTQAVKLARQFFNEIYQDEDIQNLMLEEVVIDDDSNEWQITFGYDANTTKEASTIFSEKIIDKIPRAYKRIHIDADEGDFKDMFNREVE
ncbi:hypothetical protein [uncultured Psychrobacter sp.]|uniref:hypothetical protein n=1 Tax=uncultured Psychrobacter sp. TaxID=259303 RepID=UPI00345AAD08